jgi:hypothetical protein
VPDPIVVAGDKNLLHMPPVRSAVAGEYALPVGSDILKVGNEPEIDDIAADHDRIDAVVAEILERVAERLAVGVPYYVHIADYAELEFRSFAGTEQRRRPQKSASAESAERRRTADEKPARDFIPDHFFSPDDADIKEYRNPWRIGGEPAPMSDLRSQYDNKSHLPRPPFLQFTFCNRQE